MQADLEKAKNDIAEWAAGFLSQPRQELGRNSPCPFAHNAIQRGSIDFRLGTRDVRHDLMDLARTWDDASEGVVLIYDCTIEPIPFADAVEYGNEHALRERGLIALEDHPQLPEVIADLRFNQGTYALVIVQRAEKLRHASQILRAKGYYDRWSPEDLANVVDWRW